MAEQGAEPLPVTVVVAAFEQPVLLRRALESVARQRPRPPAELIVVDDGSRDETALVAAELGARVVRHPSNLGATEARNSGIRASSQPWVALLDHDDEWLPHHLATLWELRDGHVLVAASALWCGADPCDDRLHCLPPPAPLVLRSPAPLLYPGNLIALSASMVRRDALLAVEGFVESHGVADLALWVRLLEHGTAVLSPTVTLLYHLHERQTSRDVHAMQAAHLSVAMSFAGRPWWSRALIERWRGRTAWNNLRSALRRRQLRAAARHAATIAARPARARGAVEAWVLSARLRRRSATVARDGGPSVAVLGTPRQLERARLELDGRPLVDLTGRGRAASLVRLARRPSAIAYVDSARQARLLRLFGVHVVGNA